MTRYTLTQASQLLQSKQISAVELATEYLAAIAAQNPAINGYITLDQDKTLAEARAADARIAQGNATALTGVPIAYKDIFCQTGWRMEPPVSEPSATGARRAATTAAEPPDEPPGTCSGFHGFLVAP